jgi:hypothetical protein
VSNHGAKNAHECKNLPLSFLHMSVEAENDGNESDEAEYTTIFR